MMRVFFLVALLVGSAQALEKERPVQKIIGMLNEMKANLATEAEADEEMYDKMTCYCDSNKAEKTRSVEAAEARITQLTSTIEEMTAKSATLSTEIGSLQGEIGDNTAALEKATDIRAKENAEFVEDEKNMNEGIEGLSGAVGALSKHHGAFTQESLLALKARLPRPQAKKFMSFLQARQAPTNSGSYAPQSGEIFGMLKQMKEGFETNLADATKEEATALATFNDLKASKTSELTSAGNSVSSKEGEKAEADETASTSKTDLAETQASLAADNEFLANLKVQCDNFAAEYAERTKSRSEEQAAVGDVIAMLTDDDAHDLFSRTYNFVQVRKHKSQAVLQKAAQVINDAGKKFERPSMVALAVSMRAGVNLDNFGNVKDKVNKMIDDLMKEKEEEIKVADKCRAELKENADSTETSSTAAGNLQTNIDDLTNMITNLKDEIATLNQEIAETRINMKRASEDREAENKEFQATVADQRATQAILTKALNRLSEVYGSLVQTWKQAPSFGAYKKNQSGGGVLNMLNGVIKEAADLEKEALKAEQDAQTSYEELITDSNNSISAKEKDIASKTETKGEKEGELVTAEGDLKATNADLDALRGINTGLHADCDFLLNNYDLRQEARDNEVESLKMAVAMLSGADFR